MRGKKAATLLQGSTGSASPPHTGGAGKRRENAGFSSMDAAPDGQQCKLARGEAPGARRFPGEPDSMHYIHEALDIANEINRGYEEGHVDLAETAKLNFRRFLDGNLDGPRISDLAVWMLRRHEPEARATGLDLMIRLSDVGLNAARYNLALEKYTGAMIERDRTGAMAMFKDVFDTERSNPALLACATAALGFALLDRRRDNDTKRAVALLVDAAQKGHELAAYTAGLIFHGKLECEDIPIDYVKAAHFYQMAADQGNAVAQANLGRLIATGIVPDTNPRFGTQLAILAGMNGDALAEGVLVDLLQATESELH